MSRPRKKPVEEPVVEEPVVEEPVVEETPAVVIKETPAVQPQTNGDDKAATLEWVTRYIGEHSRRRAGSVSGMLPTVYRITISGGRVRFFTLPISIEECAVEESWRRCKPYMSTEEFIAFLTRVAGIAPPPFYSVFRVINID